MPELGVHVLVKFPVISIKGGTIDIHKSEGELRRCTKLALKKRWYDGLTILDRDGVLHTVRGAKYVRDTGQKAYPGLFASKLVEVELEMEVSERRLSLEDVRQTMRRALSADPGFWESSGRDLSKVLKDLDAAASIDEIWQV